MKIFLSKILSFEGEQLTEENLANFKKLVFKGWESNFTRVYTGDKLAYVSFYWGDKQYPDYVTVKINQYFLFNIKDKNEYMIADDLYYNSIKII